MAECGRLLGWRPTRLRPGSRRWHRHASTGTRRHVFENVHATVSSAALDGYPGTDMPRIRLTADLPYEVGALYSRREDIHGRLGGQRQGGISTPIKSPFVVLFTGEAGAQHGYHDHWEEENGESILHYYGGGQEGDMQDVRATVPSADMLQQAGACSSSKVWAKVSRIASLASSSSWLLTPDMMCPIQGAGQGKQSSSSSGPWTMSSIPSRRSATNRAH